MPSIRRGFGVAAAAREKAGRIASRSGRAIATPEARRKARREQARWVETNEPGKFMEDRLLGLEEIALDDFVNERTHPVLTGLRAIQDLLEFRAVAESNRSAGRKYEELPCKVSGDLTLVGKNQALEFPTAKLEWPIKSEAAMPADAKASE